MSIIHLAAVGGEEPTAADLAVIDEEWPLIAAELDLLDAEIALINAGPEVSVLDRRRIRRAERRVLAVKRQLAAEAERIETLPCGCPGSVITSALRDCGEQCSSCGSTWDRNDQLIIRRGSASDGAA